MTMSRKMRDRMARAVEEARELADRFPDLPDRDVIEHVEFVTKLALRRDERGAVLVAYEEATAPDRYEYAERNLRGG